VDWKEILKELGGAYDEFIKRSRGSDIPALLGLESQLFDVMKRGVLASSVDDPGQDIQETLVLYV
tara:strand:+ start:726 stop:920 length:195 start_codon:yes stop_codon:yes gene_type:complete